MIQDSWKRIAGMKLMPDGTIGAAWLAHDRQADVVHLYDCALFKVEVPAVIAEGFNARGRWIPVAWAPQAKAMAEELIKRGCGMEPKPCDDSEGMAEILSREIWGRMRSGRFRVERRLTEWREEYKSYFRKDTKVPKDSHPLMSATRIAIGHLDFARAQAATHGAGINYPKVAIT